MRKKSVLMRVDLNFKDLVEELSQEGDRSQRQITREIANQLRVDKIKNQRNIKLFEL